MYTDVLVSNLLKITLGINTWSIGSACHTIRQENTCFHKLTHCYLI